MKKDLSVNNCFAYYSRDKGIAFWHCLKPLNPKNVTLDSPQNMLRWENWVMKKDLDLKSPFACCCTTEFNSSISHANHLSDLCQPTPRFLLIKLVMMHVWLNPVRNSYKQFRYPLIPCFYLFCLVMPINYLGSYLRCFGIARLLKFWLSLQFSFRV